MLLDSRRASAPTVFRPSWLCGSLARTFGLGHGAVVEQRGKHPPDDRSKDVEPYATEVSGHDHRSERACRVDRPAGYRSRDEYPYREREAHRYGRYRCRGPVVGGHGHHHEHQDEGDEDLHHERLQVSNPLSGVGGRQLRLTPRARTAEGYPGGQGG